MASKAELLTAWWILSVLVLNLSSVNSQTCAANSVGPGASVSRAEYITDNSLDSLFLIANGHPINCYGVIQSWSFRTAQQLTSGPCYTSLAQIWRPSPANSLNYLLVGENTLFDTAYCSSNLDSNNNRNTEIPLSIPPNSRIPVQPGDVIAWHDIGGVNHNDRKIGFDSGLPGSSYMSTVYVLQNGPCIPGVGSACSWQNSQTVGRNYGINIILGVRKPPVILNLPNSISITELLSVGTFLFQVQASNEFTWNPTITPPLTYSIVPAIVTPCNMSWFEIDSITGSITVGNLFNVNSLTYPLYSCDVTVEVKQDGAPATQSVLTVNITNINEPHQIDNLPFNVTLNSAALTASKPIYTVTFSDPDLASFAYPSKSFAITDISPPYYIFSITTTPPGTGQISTTRRLDDWTGPDVFKISVTVSDGEFVAGPQTLTVILTDIIQPPVLQNLNATIILEETTPNGAVVYRVKSFYDMTRVSTITYAILSQVPFSNPRTFDISSSANEGFVTLFSSLDYLAAKQYAVEIQATLKYGGATLVSKPGTLTVDVKWVDEAPMISITPTTTTVMSEDAVPGTPVPGVTITATDREYDNNLGDYLVFFVSDPHFVVNNVTKTLYTSESLVILPPLNCSQTYTLQVSVQDSYGKGASSSVDVKVIKGNRGSPKFSQTQYNGSVAENGAGGSPTGVQLSAMDSDCGENGTITYSILGELANLYFRVDSATGVITQKQPISQPTYPNITFTVVASDGGRPSLNSTAVVYIVVSAINAHGPWFAPPYIEIETRSDSPVGSSIYTLNVTDPDSASVNDISYQIVVLQDDFDVRSSGDIVPKRKLSSYKRYTLYVMANDTGQGKNYFTDPATVVIDTYDAGNQLIDIEMLRPLLETDPKLPEFMVKLNDFLKPWIVIMEDLKYSGDNTVITIYAYDAVSTFSSEPTPKQFIDRDALLAKLRTDIYGTPVDGLREPEFKDYEIVSVMPTYPVWVLDTVEGIATLTVVCVVALALIITAIVLLLKFFKLACFRQNKVAPAPEKSGSIKGGSDGGEFKLSYVNTEPYMAKTAEMTMSDLEPFERPPTYKANSPPFRPDADLEL